MVDKVYIVWCKLNKSTTKFDMGIFTKKKTADETAEFYKPEGKTTYPKTWVSEYKLS